MIAAQIYPGRRTPRACIGIVSQANQTQVCSLEYILNGCPSFSRIDAIRTQRIFELQIQTVPGTAYRYFNKTPNIVKSESSGGAVDLRRR